MFKKAIVVMYENMKTKLYCEILIHTFLSVQADPKLSDNLLGTASVDIRDKMFICVLITFLTALGNNL